jgi:hypothetical protein
MGCLVANTARIVYSSSCITTRPNSVIDYPFPLQSVLTFQSTSRGPCRSEAPSTGRAVPDDHVQLVGGADAAHGSMCSISGSGPNFVLYKKS